VSTDKDLHLNEDQLVKAVVEEDGLPLPLREHLLTCPECRANKQVFEQDLARLGQMAERASPSPRRKVSLPVEESRHSTGWWWGWRASLGATAAAALVIILVWGVPILRNTSIGNGDMLDREMQEAEQFMTEIDLLVENALPPVYSDISVESNTGLDEEFIEFMVPSIDEESISYDSGKRGVLLC
jgi:hypothetical protein